MSHFTLSLLALGLGATCIACSNRPPPILIEKYCVSETGLTKIWLTLNTSERTGTIRYRYMGQDIRYALKAMQIDGYMVAGSADFQGSSTGETKGNPFIFRYESGSEILRDGNMTARCQNAQGPAR